MIPFPMMSRPNGSRQKVKYFCRLAMSFAIVLTTILGFSAAQTAAQNAGGLPGIEHTLARVAFLNSERVVVHGDVVHYSFDISVGPGEFDTIRLHRVVKETAPGRLAKKMEGILLLPGAPNFFEQIFMPPASPMAPPENGSVALFLASHDIDVWGMEYGWTSVPYGTTDFTPLIGWGVDKDVEHAHIALSIVRWMRVTSGQGAGPIHLLGFSYGGFLTWAVAGEDTQLPGNLKNVKSIIPVDGAIFKAAQGSSTQINACNALPAIIANIAAGVAYTENSGWIYGEAALTAPDEPSTLLPPFTNFQAAQALLVMGGFLRGSYSTSSPSVTLFHTYSQRAVNLLGHHLIAGTPPRPYVPYQVNYDNNASRCGSDAYPVAFDDHLGEITVPIYHVARTFTGFYAATLTASSDASMFVVNSPSTPTHNYGHADFFLADNAADPADNAANKIWRPILEWIQAHADSKPR